MKLMTLNKNTKKNNITYFNKIAFHMQRFIGAYRYTIKSLYISYRSNFSFTTAIAQLGFYQGRGDLKI